MARAGGRQSEEPTLINSLLGPLSPGSPTQAPEGATLSSRKTITKGTEAGKVGKVRSNRNRKRKAPRTALI